MSLSGSKFMQQKQMHHSKTSHLQREVMESEKLEKEFAKVDK
jgi:hypothetical protein